MKKSKGLLTASIVLIVLSAILFMATFFHVSWARVLFGIVLIIFGVVILVKSLRRKVE
ncbi:MAG: hypothetical protein H5T94_02130 [Pseudothermotoga sp.]|nr:hypothetical protein [Pseudothermotoga sp.]